jgi:hypothetical protein
MTSSLAALSGTKFEALTVDSIMREMWVRSPEFAE